MKKSDFYVLQIGYDQKTMIGFTVFKCSLCGEVITYEDGTDMGPIEQEHNCVGDTSDWDDTE